jgi:antitoxin component HigA of HigAB toxin-antitoxin module
MPEQDLDALLEDLRKAVSSSDELTEAQRAQLKNLQAQIRMRLDAGQPEPDEDPVEAMRGYIDQFQRSHPTLTMTLGRILDVLNKMGI